jgi:hypothetical protein
MDMENQQQESEQQSLFSISKFEGFLWIILCVLIFAIFGMLINRYKDEIKSSFFRAEIENYDEITVTDGFHHVELINGQSWDLSYEANRERNFAGVVRHTSMINEPEFAILSHDILVTSEDYANQDLVYTSVKNHHFTWSAPSLGDPKGRINLLHTFPLNDEVKQQLDAIKNGDTVVITGWDIYRITGYDSDGQYIGYWQDSGCNTTLVIAVEILKPDDQ